MYLAFEFVVVAKLTMPGKLLELASRVVPFQVRTRKCGRKTRKSAPYVDAAVGRSHHRTPRFLTMRCSVSQR